MRKIAIVLFILFFAVLSAEASFLPEDFVVDTKSLPKGESNITEAEFKKILGDINQAYASVVSRHGGQLVMQGEWKSETLNAAATQMFGRWMVRISGALARRPELTPDGFALIVCHELGHHLGGFALAPADIPFAGVWAANEGQADYFSTQVCARKIWAHDLAKNAEFRNTASEIIKEKCDQIWKSTQDQNLCYRALMGSESVIFTMATLKKEAMPSYTTPDSSVVGETSSRHPATQCRMDTLLEGGICAAAFSESVIPGKKVPGGPASEEAEREAAINSCTNHSGYQQGLRPACWFKARM